MWKERVKKCVEEVWVDQEVERLSVGTEVRQCKSGNEEGEDERVDEEAWNGGGEVPEEGRGAPVRGTVGAGWWEDIGEKGR